MKMVVSFVSKGFLTYIYKMYQWIKRVSNLTNIYQIHEKDVDFGRLEELLQNEFGSSYLVWTTCHVVTGDLDLLKWLTVKDRQNKLILMFSSLISSVRGKERQISYYVTIDL